MRRLKRFTLFFKQPRTAAYIHRVLAHDSFKKEIGDALSKTTLNKEVLYIQRKEIKNYIEELVNKEVLVFGYEQFHLLIRSHYERFASKHNLVRLHE